jgi:hypothetical protein
MDYWYADKPGEVIDCRRPYSFFFDLIDPLMVGVDANPRVNSNPLHRVCSLMRKMKADFLVKEQLRSHELLSEESIAVSVRTGVHVVASATRITFFRNSPELRAYPDYPESTCLGYVVIFDLKLENKPSVKYIYEAVVRMPCLWLEDGTSVPLSNYYTSACRPFTFALGTHENHSLINITGTYFCQQNDLTHVCAHAALRMAINNSWVRPSHLLTPEEINKLLGFDHVKRTVGHNEGSNEGNGLTPGEISKVVESLGARVQTAIFNNNPSIDYQDFIYPIAESGCPVILGISRPNFAHVVTILGHTLNSDRWMPQAQAENGYGGYPLAKYISSTAWVDHFVISDDNFGMFVTLQTEGIRNILVPKFNSNLHASVAIGIVPNEVKTEGSTVEQLVAFCAVRLLEAVTKEVQNIWLKRLQTDTKAGSLVCRTLLATREDYIAHWRANRDQKNTQILETTLKELEQHLPERFWVTELSVPNLYAGNKRKLGDVVTASDVDVTIEKAGAIRAILLPEVALLANGGKLVTTQGKWDIGGHVPLLRGHWSKESTTEW